MPSKDLAVCIGYLSLIISSLIKDVGKHDEYYCQMTCVMRMP
jgi:hypothetical protein